jgi:hypothetical protein
MKADLLADLHAAVGNAIEKGTGLEAFRKDFKRIVDKHGWHGWTGEGWAFGEAWRTRVIWETNLATSYAAGRYAQLTDPELLARRPYWMYVHNERALDPRPQHLAWNGLTLRHDHPFWQTHYPPNGWGCGCRVTAVRAPKDGDKTEPPEGWDKRDAKDNLPGIDKNWDYAPGASVSDDLRRIVEEKTAKLSEELAAPFKEEVSRLYMEQAGRGGAFSAEAKRVAEALAQSARLSKAEGDARAWVIGKGKETGREHIVLYDLASGREAFRNVGEAFRVLVDPAAILKAERAGQSLRTVHSHPDSFSLSLADLASLGHEVIQEVEAVGLDGVSVYLASRDANFARIFRSRLKARGKAGLTEALQNLSDRTDSIFDKYGIPRDIQSHILCQALEKEGVIAYTPTMSAAHEHLYKRSLADKALADIVGFLKNQA